jgi:hypothetical protein
VTDKNVGIFVGHLERTGLSHVPRTVYIKHGADPLLFVNHKGNTLGNTPFTPVVTGRHDGIFAKILGKTYLSRIFS